MHRDTLLTAFPEAIGFGNHIIRFGGVRKFSNTFFQKRDVVECTNILAKLTIFKIFQPRTIVYRLERHFFHMKIFGKPVTSFQSSVHWMNISIRSLDEYMGHCMHN